MLQIKHLKEHYIVYIAVETARRQQMLRTARYNRLVENLDVISLVSLSAMHFSVTLLNSAVDC